MPIYTQRSRKSQPDMDPRSRQIDELQRISAEKRNMFLGADWFRTSRMLYNLSQGSAVRPTYRPAVTIPQLQLLNLNEATDISSLNPKVYITKKKERDEEREKAFQDHWRWQNINNRILFAELWALYVGTAFLQVGWDPYANLGDGEVWADWIDPETVYPDPAAKSDRDWTYVIVESRIYPDEVRNLWPESGAGIVSKPQAGSPNLNLVGESSGFGFELPPGPLSFMPGIGPQTKPSGDGRVRLRICHCLDYSVVETKESSVDKALKTLQDKSARHTLTPKFRPRYPNGRYIVECEGRILVDSDNPFPRTSLVKFPIVPIWTLPNLTNFWAPPPPRFSIDLQSLAERMYAQTFENAVRLNNGTWFIDEATGIDANDFGGLPGEVRIINSGSKVPEARFPSAMPDWMMKMPATLLALQKELQGFTTAREGQAAHGNTSAGLFDATLYQSQFLTRLRSMLLAESIQKFAELYFFTMCRYYRTSRYFPAFKPAEGDESSVFSFSDWKPIDNAQEDYRLDLDPGSIRPISQASMRQLVTGLRAAGLLSVRDSLEALEIPGAEEKAGQVEAENQLAALAKIKRR